VDTELPPWPPGYDDRNNPVSKSNLIICHGKWIVFVAYWDDQPEGPVAGIFVFGITDFQLASHKKVPYERYDRIAQSADDPGVFVAAGSELVDVYTVEECGLLKVRNSFPLTEPPDGVDCLVVSASHVYVDGLLERDFGQRIDVYDIFTGRLERRIECPYPSVVALTFWKSGSEIPVGSLLMIPRSQPTVSWNRSSNSSSSSSPADPTHEGN